MNHQDFTGMEVGVLVHTFVAFARGHYEGMEGILPVRTIIDFAVLTVNYFEGKYAVLVSRLLMYVIRWDIWLGF